MKGIIFISFVSLMIYNSKGRVVDGKAIDPAIAALEETNRPIDWENQNENEEANWRAMISDLSDHSIEPDDLNATELDRIADLVAASRLNPEPRLFKRLEYDHPDLGEVGRDEPLMHIGVLPESDLKIGTLFYLEHTEPCDYSTDIRFACERCIPLNYDVALRIADRLPYCQVLTSTIHGYKSAPFKDLNRALSNHHVNYYNSSCNLVVDWSKGAKNDLIDVIYDRTAYTRQAANVITVGRQLGLLLYNLIALGKVEPKKIHLIGHSLGAQVAHHASTWLRHLSESDSHPDGWKPGRISGLDPAAPLFQGHPGAHLDKDDADFVDVIHTSAVNEKDFFLELGYLRGRLGMAETLGHVDFYPNGGSTPQYPCAESYSSILGFTYACSHSRAVEYFLDSIDRHPRFYLSHPCNETETIFGLSGAALEDDKHLGSSVMGMRADKQPGRGKQCLTFKLPAAW